MNPYLSPYTMPDGSTRRPIVERVPECRHRRMYSDGLSWSCTIPEDVAIDLCRVACEDWLRKQRREDKNTVDAGPRWEIMCAILDGTDSVLVSRAHLVADAKGIER